MQWGEYSDTDLDQKDTLFLHIFITKYPSFLDLLIFRIDF